MCNICTNLAPQFLRAIPFRRVPERPMTPWLFNGHFRSRGTQLTTTDEVAQRPADEGALRHGSPRWPGRQSDVPLTWSFTRVRNSFNVLRSNCSMLRAVLFGVGVAPQVPHPWERRAGNPDGKTWKHVRWCPWHLVCYPSGGPWVTLRPPGVSTGHEFKQFNPRSVLCYRSGGFHALRCGCGTAGAAPVGEKGWGTRWEILN
eukprot:gene6738-biopygen10465